MFSLSDLNQLQQEQKNWSFDQALDFLASARKFGIRPGLERIKQLLELLGNPQNAYPVVHIAGTNGKGSVSSMCAFIAASANKKTGLFTSPYLTNFNERIRIIDGHKGLQDLQNDQRAAEISNHYFAKIMALIAWEIEVMKTKGFETPTEFEMITAAAFVYFAEMKCDLVILETGLGGRLDSTNVCSNKLANVITALSYDHMDRLGYTMREIASEKAGIIQENVPTILYNPFDTELSKSDAAAALEVIQDQATAMHSELTIVKRADIVSRSSSIHGQTFSYKEQGPYEIRLAGDYQMENAAVAIEASRYITDQPHIVQGLGQAQWPGRLECLAEDPLILIDGAHNYQGVTGLRKHLETFFKDKKLIVLFGVLRDKDHSKMLDHFLGSEKYQVSQMICTAPDFPRAMSAREAALEISEKLAEKKIKVSLKDLAELETQRNPLYNEILFEEDLTKAARFAYQMAKQSNLPLICFGSLYMIGNVRPVLLDLSEEHIS